MKPHFHRAIKHMLCAAVLLFGTATFARDTIIITYNNGALTWPSENTPSMDGGTTVIQSFTNLSDAVDSLQDPSVLYDPGFIVGTTNFSATIDIMGFKVGLHYTAAGNSLSFGFYNGDGTFVTQTFAGTSQTDAFGQMEDFFQSDAGAALFDDYMSGVQKYALLNFITGSESPVGQSVRDNTMRAMGNSQTEAERFMQSSGKGTGIFSIGAEYTKFKTDDFSGESYTVPIVMGGRLTKSTSLEFRLPLNYTDIEGTEFYRFGTELDLGVKLVGVAGKPPFEWEITPTVGNYLAGTTDLLVGGDIYNYGIQNRFQLNQGPVSVSYGAYYGWYKSAEISLGDYNVDLNVDEEILSHGVKVMYRMGRNMVIDAYGIDSAPNGTDGFRQVRTFGGSLSLRINGASNSGAALVRLGYAKDEGQDSENDDFKAERYFAELAFRY